MLSIELLGLREFEVTMRYRETYVRVVDHVKIQELDRYNYGSLHAKGQR
jgi:hypothetical protein